VPWSEEAARTLERCRGLGWVSPTGTCCKEKNPALACLQIRACIRHTCRIRINFFSNQIMLKKPGLRIRITLMRIRIQLFTSMRIQIQLISYMLIRIQLPKILRIHAYPDPHSTTLQKNKNSRASTVSSDHTSC
jgi:hypothetical protein